MIQSGHHRRREEEIFAKKKMPRVFKWYATQRTRGNLDGPKKRFEVGWRQRRGKRITFYNLVRTSISRQKEQYMNDKANKVYCMVVGVNSNGFD